MNPTMPLKQFKTLVKVQTDSGVQLIDGHHDHRSAKMYVSCVAEAVAEKCVGVLSSKHFMSILSDGSQARKTKSDKEMVMVRFERNGLPCYIMASLLEMSNWGGTDAESLFNGINSIFEKDGMLEMEDYQTKLVSCTADGASVNFGGWLIKAACEAINVKHYVLPKLNGTRFTGHRITSFTALINIWPALITALSNVAADKNTTTAVRSKVKGILAGPPLAFLRKIWVLWVFGMSKYGCFMGIFGILFQNMGVLWVFLTREILMKGALLPHFIPLNCIFTSPASIASINRYTN